MSADFDQPSMFDVAPFQIRPSKIKRRTAKPAAPETVVVAIDKRWRAVSTKRPGLIHCLASPGGSTSYCGMIVSPRTFANGDRAPGCAACVAAGAPWREVAS